MNVSAKISNDQCTTLGKQAVVFNHTPIHAFIRMREQPAYPHPKSLMRLVSQAVSGDVGADKPGMFNLMAS